MNQSEWIDQFRKANNKLLLLDYDGTLVELVSDPDLAFPSKRLLDVLIQLMGNHQTTVIVISGRSHLDIDKFLGHLPVNIIAEHGAMRKENGVWKKQYVDNGLWKKKVIPIMNAICSDCPESFVEDKYFSVTWHYRNAEKEIGYSCSRELIDLLQESIQEFQLKILDGNKVVEVMSTEIGKGKAVMNLLLQNNYKYIVSIGDDKTDEDMFAFFSKHNNAATIKVGKGNTGAKYKLKNVDEVILLLEHLSSGN